MYILRNSGIGKQCKQLLRQQPIQCVRKQIQNTMRNDNLKHVETDYRLENTFIIQFFSVSVSYWNICVAAVHVLKSCTWQPRRMTGISHETNVWRLNIFMTSPLTILDYEYMFTFCVQLNHITMSMVYGCDTKVSNALQKGIELLISVYWEPSPTRECWLSHYGVILHIRLIYFNECIR